MSEKRFSISYILHSLKDVQLMIFVLSLDSRNTKKLKTKMLIFYKQQSCFSQIVFKKANLKLSFFKKNSKYNNIILGFSFWFYVFGFSLSNNKQFLPIACFFVIIMSKFWSLIFLV